MSKPTVSLIITTYNRSSRIVRAIESVLEQTTPPDEIIIVDDGSSDGTAEVIRTKYPEIKLLQIPNSGVSIARNTGAELAKGSILIFFDDDDEMLPHAVESLTKLLDEFHEARAAYADHEYINHINGIHYHDHHTSQPAFARLRKIPIQRRLGGARLYDRSLYYALLRGNLLQQPWMIYRQDFLKMGGFASGIRYEDWELFTRICHHMPIVLSDEVISRHHVEAGMANNHIGPGQAEQQIKAAHLLVRDTFWHDLEARRILYHMIGLLRKGEGDRVRDEDLKSAWFQYLESIKAWPFDHVVLARLLLWFPKICLDGLVQWFARPREKQGQ